ncbi:MAG: hypothetical protein EBZ28_07035 [Alphaproteobacteria bacterium]|nr:hypothetical protein [Alphaproteobacteria bacterium]
MSFIYVSNPKIDFKKAIKFFFAFYDTRISE